MNTNLNVNAIIEGSIPLSALSSDIKTSYNLALNAVQKEEYNSDQGVVAAALNNVAATTVQGIDGLTGSGLIGDGNITISHYTPERSTGTTSNVTLNGSTTFQVPSYGFDTYGHVTGATGITYTLPSATTGSDTKVSVATSTSQSFIIGTTYTGTTTSATTATKCNIYMSGNTIHGATGYYQDSDERLKTFHGEVDVDLEKLSQLPKAYFTWNESENGEMQIGTSAQKVRELYPEIVSEDENGKLSVDYSKLSVIALKGVEKLYDKVKTMETELTLIKEKLGL